MKKKDNLFFLTNNILIGVDAIIYMFYTMTILMAGVSVAYLENTEEDAVKQVVRLSHYGIGATVAVIAVLIAIVLLNNYFYKNKKLGIVKILTILLTMGFVVIMVRNISIFIG